MSDPTLPPDEVLERYLNGKRTGSELPADDAALADALLAAAAAAQPDPRFAAQLEARLKQSASPAHPSGSNFFSFLWSPTVKRLSAFTLVTVLILVLLLGGAWLLQPQPQPALPETESATATALATDEQTQGTSAVTGEATTEATATAEATAVPATEVPPAPPQFAAGLTFPTAPATANLYNQVSQPFTPQSAQQMADLIGLKGPIYSYQGEGSDPVYVVTDGQSRMIFTSPDALYFVVNYVTTLNDNGQPLPNDQAQTIATDFLKAHNLLPANYQAAPTVGYSNSFDFWPVVDDLPITIGSQAYIQVALTSDGEVRSVMYRGPQLNLLGSLPIISAEEAWHRAVDPSGSSVQASSYYVAPVSVPYQAWTRQYQPDDAVDMTGYMEVLKPIDPSNPPFIALNNWPLNGNLEGLAAQGNSPVHVVGHLTLDEGGRPWITVDQWNAVSGTNLNVMGQIERDGTDAFLVMDGKRYRLPDLPANVPTGADVTVSGAPVEGTDPHFEWWLVSTGNGGGGGGGGGGGIGFREVSLTPITQVTVQPTPFSPYQIGDTLEDVHGELSVTRQQNTDGSEETHYMVSIYSATSGFVLNLMGDKMAGNEQYNSLPVRVWGTVAAMHPEFNSLDIQVERIEPVYPDLKIQAWLGSDAVATVSDKTVDLISSDDGQKFIVDYTLDPPVGYVPSPMSSPDLKTIYEGYIVPGQTFNGYPLVHIVSTSSGDSLDLATYQLRSSQIPVVNPSVTGAVPANLIIEKIELTYLVQDFSHGSPIPAADCTCRTVQPVWRFTGHTPDGQGYEIDVQAVPDDYLK